MGELVVICIGTSVHVRTNSSKPPLSPSLLSNFQLHFKLDNKHNQSYRNGSISVSSELPPGLRSRSEQADQSGALCQLCLPVYVLYYDRDDVALPGFAKFFN